MVNGSTWFHLAIRLECRCTDSPGQDASPSPVSSQQCRYSFAAEYSEANNVFVRIMQLITRRRLCHTVFSMSGIFSRHCALIHHYMMRLPKKIFVVFINRLFMLSIPMPGCKCMCVCINHIAIESYSGGTAINTLCKPLLCECDLCLSAS